MDKYCSDVVSYCVSDVVIVVFMYLVGAIPFAYILALRTGVDLREHGSRNIGARNAFEVTKRKDIGSAVLVLDLLKGLIPALLLDYYLAAPPILPLALVALVAGHCYSIWLQFHGGRGLATAAGILLVASPLLVVVWLAGYVLARVMSNDTHVKTVVALVVLIPVILLLNDEWSYRVLFRSRNYTMSYGIISLQMSFLGIVALILSRHFGPLAKKLRDTKS